VIGERHDSFDLALWAQKLDSEFVFHGCACSLFVLMLSIGIFARLMFIQTKEKPPRRNGNNEAAGKRKYQL